MAQENVQAEVQPTQLALPRHVAIIMDGNGRWANKKNLPRYMGHREGVKAVRRIVSACQNRGIEVLTLFAFSSENWRRPKAEVGLLMDLFVHTLKKEVNRLDRNGVNMRFIGNRTAAWVGTRPADPASDANGSVRRILGGRVPQSDIPGRPRRPGVRALAIAGARGRGRSRDEHCAGIAGMDTGSGTARRLRGLGISDDRRLPRRANRSRR